MSDAFHSSVTYLQTRCFANPKDASFLVRSLAMAGHATEELRIPGGATLRPDWPSIGRIREWSDPELDPDALSFVELTLPVGDVEITSPLEPITTGLGGLEGVVYPSIALTSFGFMVLSLTVRPKREPTESQLVEWVAQFIRLEQYIPPAFPAAKWTIAGLFEGPTEPDHNRSTVSEVFGGARDIFLHIFKGLFGPNGRTLLLKLIEQGHEGGTASFRGKRQHRWWNGLAPLDPPPDKVDRAFWDPSTYGVHVSLASSGRTPDERRDLLDRVRNRASELHGGPVQHVKIEPEMSAETWMFGEFSTYVFDGRDRAVANGRDHSITSRAGPGFPGSVEHRCSLHLSTVVALKKGLLSSVARATNRAILHDEALSPKHDLRSWQWLATLSRQDFVLPWERGRLLELVEASESGKSLQGLRFLEAEVDRNLAAFARKSDARISRGLTAMATAIGVASLAGPGVDLISSNSLGSTWFWVGLIFIVLAVVFVGVVLWMSREREIKPRS